MANASKPVGSSIVHPTRPNIHHLIGKDVTVTHHDPKHGTWEGELLTHYCNGNEKAEDFVYKVEGTPCDYCEQRCTDGEGQGCDTWNGIPELERFEHSSQPTMMFGAHAVYSLSGNVIVLG